jgi:hypothetical protein
LRRRAGRPQFKRDPLGSAPVQLNRDVPRSPPSPGTTPPAVALPARGAAFLCIVMGGLLLLPGPKWALQVIPAVCLLASGFGLLRGRRDAAILAIVLNLAWLAMAVADGLRANLAGVVAVAVPGSVIGGILYSWRTLRADRPDHRK